LNHHHATLTSSHKINNISERWYNRLKFVIRKQYPDRYSAFGEFQKQQPDVEIMITELSLEQKVRAQPKRKWQIMSIAANFDTY